LRAPDHPPINRSTDGDAAATNSKESDAAESSQKKVAKAGSVTYIDVSALAGRPWKGKARRADAALEQGKPERRATDLEQVRSIGEGIRGRRFGLLVEGTNKRARYLGR
jgi:hypothetical protein